MRIASRTHQSGFTLIEMLVSIALFAVVVTTSVGTLLVMVDANARSQSVQIAINNLSFALDAMTRQIRTGTEFHCANNQAAITTGGSPGVLRTTLNDCINGGEAIAFTDTRTGDRYGFALEQGGTAIQRKVDSVSSPTGAWLDLTGSNIRITTLDFWVGGTAQGANDEQPSVTIYIEAEVGDITGLGSNYQIQTTVVQRKYDL